MIFWMDCTISSHHSCPCKSCTCHAWERFQFPYSGLYCWVNKVQLFSFLVQHPFCNTCKLWDMFCTFLKTWTMVPHHLLFGPVLKVGNVWNVLFPVAQSLTMNLACLTTNNLTKDKFSFAQLMISFLLEPSLTQNSWVSKILSHLATEAGPWKWFTHSLLVGLQSKTVFRSFNGKAQLINTSPPPDVKSLNYWV